MDKLFFYICLAVSSICSAILIFVVLSQSKMLKEQAKVIAVQTKQFEDAQEQLEELEKQSAVSAELSKQSFEYMQKSMNENYSSLSKSLDSKIAGSFTMINEYLQGLNKDLGEMKSVASGIEDVKKVLSNVKTRGILGEIQLGAILKEILSPSQYDENINTIPGSSNRVEFAVKLPGDNSFVYLPIDSKFPGDRYAHLLDAYDKADAAVVDAEKKLLLTQLKSEAADIKEKYVKSPYTTDFGIMFLPFEGLYAEAVNLGAIEVLQKEYNVIIAGPSTLAALLNSLQMGFKTLAIQENAQHVWEVLGKVKSEFESYAKALDDTQKSLQKASDNLDKLAGTRTRAIRRVLKEVEEIEGGLSGDTLESVEYDDTFELE